MKSSPKHSKKKTTTFRFEGPYYSIARRCYRILLTSTREPRRNFQDEVEASIEMERLEDSKKMETMMFGVENFRDFEFLIAGIMQDRPNTFIGMVTVYGPAQGQQRSVGKIG
jgi:hypothetical protein